MDIKMLPINGVETYRKIKEIKPEAVVMITAYAVEGLVQSALKEGAYGITYKPPDMERVAALIKEARG
jgi:two-component system response regulator HydG